MKLVPNERNVILNALEKFGKPIINKDGEEKTIIISDEERRRLEAARGRYQTTSVHAVGEKCNFVKKGDIVLVRATAIVPFEYDGNDYALINEDLIVAKLK